MTEGAAEVVCLATDGTGTAAADLASATAMASFTEGQSTAYCVFTAVDDSTAEAFESLTVELVAPLGGIAGAPSTAELLIVDDDGGGEFSLTSTAAVVTEGDSVYAEIVRAGDLAGGTIVYVSFNEGSATWDDLGGGGWDFYFHEGDTHRGGYLPIVDDLIPEPYETFTVGITGVSGTGTVTVSLMTVTIVDNDGPLPPPAVLPQPEQADIYGYTSVTIDFVLPPGVTCASDSGELPFEGSAECSASDVILTEPLSLVEPPSVHDTDLSDPTVVSVTVTGNAVGPGTGTVELAVKYEGEGYVSSEATVTVHPSAAVLTAPTTVSAGGSHSLALDGDGELWHWGSDFSGQFPWPGPLRPRHYPFPAQLASVDAGGGHSMGVTATGDVWTWGYDAYGQMGDGPGGFGQPFHVPFPASAVAISAGSSHSFALLSDGTLWAWGANDRGQLGLGYATPYPSDPLGVETPQPVLISDVATVAAAKGGGHTLALKSDGTVWGWGEASAILTSLPEGGWPNEPIVAPQHIPGLTDVTAIAAGGYRSLALKSDGTVWEWAAWSGLQQVQGLPDDIVAITAGPNSAHALTSTGEVYGWGGNYRGSVGDGTFDARPMAVPLNLSGTAVQISDGGSDHSLARLADGRIFAWGANGNGMLGIGTDTDTPTPTQVLFGPSDTVTCSGEQWPTRYPFTISCSADLADGSSPVTWVAMGLTPDTQVGTSASFATALPDDDPLPPSWPASIEASWTDPQGNPRTVTLPRTIESPASCYGGQSTTVHCSLVVGGDFGTWTATGFSPEFSNSTWQEFTRPPYTSGTITVTFAGRQQVFDFPWPAPPPAVPELRWVAPAGNVILGQRYDFRSVGSRVHACVFDGVTGMPMSLPAFNIGDIVVAGSGGHTGTADPDPNLVDPIVYIGGGQSQGALCLSWVSTEAGEQDLSLGTVWNGAPFVVGWDSNGDGNGNPALVNAPLTAGWAVVDTIELSYGGTVYSGNDAVDPLGAVSATTWPPSQNTLQVAGQGQYVDGSGVVHHSSSLFPPTGIFGLTIGITPSDQCVQAPLVFEGAPAVYQLDVSGCPPSTELDLTVTVQAPGVLGSGPSPTATGILHVTVQPQTPAAKHVLLAWAGQRVILEHDWRLLFGGIATNEYQGLCPFAQSFNVQYVQSYGPGTFIATPGAELTWDPFGSHQAMIAVIGDNTQVPEEVPWDPQGACISRVLYESEDPGQVDVEAFVPEWPAAPKAAFVIFYMKFNAVTMAVETGVSKPTVNLTGGDWAPGNPWHAAAPGGPVERDLYLDVLVRGQVTGWFINENPSGRPQDPSNPLNVLPANRWVLPDDWALLAGGPADPADGSDATGTGESFRPGYNLLFAPNNSLGLECATPSGPCEEQPIGAPPPPSTLTGLIEGPYSTLDVPGPGSAALASGAFEIRETIVRDNDIDRWDAPMPPAMVSVSIRGTGYIRQVRKEDVYYLGTPDAPGQTFTNLFYSANIPASPFIPAVVAGGGYLWDSFGNDGPGDAGNGPHEFWVPVVIGANSSGVGDASLTPAEQSALDGLRADNSDPTIARDLVVYSDNHGEFMVAANGRFRGDPGTCNATSAAGTGTVTAVADYPDFRGKHFPVGSNPAVINWKRVNQVVNGVSPATVVIGSETGTFTVTGAGFESGRSQLCVNGLPVPTTVVSNLEITGELPGDQVEAGTYEVRVIHTDPGGRLSRPLVILATVEEAEVEAADAGSSDDPTDTVTVAADGGTAGSAQATTSEGTGTVAVAVYADSPATPTTIAAEAYFDIYVAPESTFTSVTVELCQAPGGPEELYWHDGSDWSEVSDYTYDGGTGCFTVVVTEDSSPSLADLGGTVFATGAPDGDGDGTPDHSDGCPAMPGPESLHGCPAACSMAPTITGTNSNDIIQGTSGDDVIFAMGGNDRVYGNGGNDVICAGDGNDTVVTGGGDDLIDTGSGNDSVSAGDGNNAVFSGDGNDTVTSGGGNDLVDTGAGNDSITAGDGDNAVFSGDGNDAVESVDGDDRIEAGTGNDTINAGAGDDHVDAGTGNDTVNGGPGTDACLPGGGSDNLSGCEP
ncbi:MAG: hypothetical protein IT303_02190 [Dehalococcoidia bacterium]|nr:hypothetical protein [Dehalococcoidia bacterium]